VNWTQVCTWDLPIDRVWVLSVLMQMQETGKRTALSVWQGTYVSSNR